MVSFGGMLLLAGAAVLMTTGAVQARGGGHGGGGHGGGFHGADHVGGYRGGYIGGYHGGYYHGGYGRGYGYRHYDGYRHYYRGYHPYYGYYPYYSDYPYLYGGDYTLENAYADDTPLLSDSATYDSGYRGLSPQEYEAYAQAATANNASAPSPIDTLAHLTVRVPAEAQIWIDGTTTTSTGPVRQFESPPLTPGSRYSYDIKASWNENGHEVTQTQHVEVTAGAHINVAFPTTAQTATK
jgi:uncharacterized protein (TIGR03000 family)